MEEIYHLKIYFIDNLYIERMTYYNDELNEEVEIIDEVLINYLESIGLNRETSFNSWQDCENINEDTELICDDNNQIIDFNNITDEDERYIVCFMHFGKFIMFVVIDNYFA